MFNLAGKLLAFILIVQICTSQQNEQSSLLRCLTGYKDSNGKLSDCPPDRVFSKCVSSCPKTCQNPYIKSDNKECLYNCLSGCVCANGTLIDEGRNRKCVPQDECTCLHHGKIFMPNEILLRNGKKCQCKNGGWICHDQPVSSRTCAVVGLTHLETFDGALLTIKPGNYLLAKSIDDTRTNFRIEASVQKDFKRQLKFTIGTNTVILSDIHTIKLNNNKLEQLPHQTTDLTIRQATSHFILIESKDMHIAYDGNAVYITLESFYRDRVRGLCGSFDYNQDNDLRLPNGKLNYDTQLFSRSYLLNDTKTDGTLEENVSKKFDRSKAEKHCHQIKNNVCKIGANAHALLLSCIEDQRFIQTNENIRASCYWHSIFAHACAFLGYDLPQKYTKWRGECESVFGKCGAGTIYEECPLSCLNSCSDRDDEHELNSVCRQQCLAGCVCTKNNYYDTNQNRHEPLKCKKESECSCFDEQKKAYHKPGSIIKRGECSTCICLRGQFECNSHKCNQSKIICPDNLIFTETSLIACPKTCSNHLTWKNCHKYRSGCDCPTDMIRDEHTNRCVFPKHCSCEFNEEIYPYGSKVTQDCNECTCASGQWSCTKLDCSRTCSILRNKHYTTFNGQNLKINSGSCEYTAAQFRHDAKKFALTLSDSVSTEHAHSLKGQLIIDGTHISLESGKHIRVNDKALTTLASSPARYSSFTIYKAGLFVVINGTHFILRWDFGNRIYLTIDCRWKGKLDGVCSEHVHPNKGLILRKKKDVNVWKVNRKCKVEINKRTDGNEKWRWSHEQCVGILNGTSSTKHSFSSCLNKLSKERRKTLYKECMEETCSCAIDSHDCTSICSWFASLSELCRKQGHPIEYWRNDAFCPLTCGENEEYKSCGTLCQKTCNDLDGRSMIKCYNDTCNEGCYCKEGYVLNHNGDCVKPRQCSEKTTKRPSSTTHLPSRSVTTSTRSSTKKPSNFTSGTSKTTPKSNSSYTVTSGVSSTTPASSITTTLLTCTETELVETLVRSNLIQIRPTDLPNKQDLITKGLNFNSNFPSIEIDLPKRGAIVRDVKLLSNSIVEIEVIFVIESGLKTSPIRGSPIALPNDEFPTEKVLDITINIIKTTDDDLPENVTLSVIVCGEDLPSTTTATTAISSTSATTVGATDSSTSTTQLEITQVSGATQLTDITTGSETVIDTLQTTINSVTTAGGQGSTALHQTTTTGGLSSTISSDTTDIQTDTTTTKASTINTTPFQCTEEEYIEALVSTNAIRIRPNDEFDKQDLITNGLDITDETSTFKIDLPAGGLIIRDVKISSLNIIKVEIVFIPESGAEPKTIQGIPTSLPIDEFPIDRIGQIIIKVLQISGGSSLEQVKLSIIGCEEASVTTSVHTTLSTIPTQGPSSSEETSTPSTSKPSSPPDESTTEGTPGRSSPGRPTNAPTQGPSSSEEISTSGTSKPSSSPDESTTEGTPGRSSPGRPTNAPTQGPSSSEETSTAETSKPSSSPDESTTEGTPGRSSPGRPTNAPTQGPSSAEETSTAETSKPSSSPDESTTEGTPGRSSPGRPTKATTQGPSSSEETSTAETSKPSSSPDESTTEGTPGRSSPGRPTNAPTQGPSSSEETSRAETSKPSSSPDESTTEGTPGRSSPGRPTKATTQGPSSAEETSTAETSKPSSSPDESTTEGTPGRSSPGRPTKATTQGPSSAEETSTAETSKPSSSPDESTTEGTPGRSSPGRPTQATTQGPSSAEETSTAETSKPSSSPDESTTEGTPGRSSPGRPTKATTQGPSSAEETSTAETSKPSSSPDESTTEGTPGRSSPGRPTKATTQGPSSAEETSTAETSKPSSSPDESTTEGTPGRSSPGRPTNAPTQGPSSSEETSTPSTSKPSSSPDESTTEGTPGRSSPGRPTKAPTQGPSSSEETTTPGTSKPSSSPDESTTEGTPGRSSPGRPTNAPTQGPSSSEETSTAETSKPSSSPDESTTEGTPGRSSPGRPTKAPTQGPSSAEETSTAETSKPSSSPDESTTEGTPGRSSPGRPTKATTQGPSSAEETSTAETSKPSSSPDESTTEGTPGRSSPGRPTKATTQGPSSAEETSAAETSKPSSSPDESTTEGTPGRSSPGRPTKATTQGPSSAEETSTAETSKPSSSPDESTTEGTPGRSSPGRPTKATTQGPSSAEETSAAETSKPSSSPDESTTEGTPGRSSPGRPTKATTQGPSSAEETSTAETSKPSSSPDESTTEGTPGRSSPGRPTKATTQGPSSAEETSTAETSKPSSSPDESTTEGTPGRSSPGRPTKATTQGPSSAEETSAAETSKPSSSPDESTTEGTPGRSSPGRPTKATTQGPSSAEETSTAETSKPSSSPDESTTEGTPGRSSPGRPTKATTQGPSSAEETSTAETSKPSSSPDESTTEGTPGRSSPGRPTKATTQGPSSAEETSAAETSKPSSSPDESTTEGTPGRSSPGRPTKATTQGPSSAEETSTAETSKPSSSPDESTTEGTPGRSSPGRPTKATTQGPSSAEETSTAETSKPSSSPDESTTEGTPGRSSPGRPTKATTQGPSSAEETSTAETSKPSSSPDESTTEGTPGRSSPGRPTKATTQGPSSAEETSTPGTSKPSSSPDESTSAGTAGPSSPEESSTAGIPGSSSPGKRTTAGTPEASPTREGTQVTGETTTAGSGSTCIEVELVETLLTANLIQITPNVTKKEDLVDVGIDFSDDQPVFEIELPDDGAVVRDVKLSSKNVVKIEVSFVHASGDLPKVIRGSPTSLPKNDFPSEKVQKIIIKVLKTSNGQSPQQVKLSVIACSETLSTTTNAPTDETTSSITHTVVTAPEEKCTDMQDIIPLGSTVFATVFINGESVTPPVIPTSLVVTELPFVIKVGFKEIATLHEVSVLNPSDSKVSSIKVATNLIDDVFSTDTNAPTVTFENDIDYVTDLTITIVSAQDNELPQKPVQLSILACLQPPHYFTKGHVDKSTRTTTRASTISSQSTRSSPLTKTTTTPSYTCEDEIALIPEQLNTEQNSLTPRFFVKPLTPYIPTNLNPGETGISFPTSDKAYIIIFPIPSAAIIKSVRLPKTTNVDQIRVMCLDEQDQPIPAQPSDNSPLQITSTLENSPNINVNFPTKVNAVHITLVHTSDNQPPQGVTVEIIICVEPSNTTQQSTVTTSHNTVTTSKTATIPPSNYTSSTPSSPSPCKPKQSPAARITIGECISQQEIQQESCAGYCPSYEEIDPVSGDISDKECLCCAPDSTYTEPIVMDCPNPTTGQNEQQTSSIIRIRSCKCSMCSGAPKTSYSNDKTTDETMDKTTHSKTKTRRR